MNKYTLKFNHLIERLKENQQVEIVNSTQIIQKDEPTANDALNFLMSEERYNPADQLVEILKIPATLSLYFFHQRSSFSGEFNFKSLFASLTSLYDPKLYNTSVHSEEQVEQLKHFSIIDDHPFSGDFKLAAFYKDPKTSPPNIPDIYFYDRGNYYKMDLDIFQYLDAMLDLAGMTNWQYLFCKTDLPQWELDHIFQNLRKGIMALKDFFPEQDFSQYEALLEMNN